jgi:hypothetical protein
MSQINYLEVGKTTHCLRCHQEIEKDLLIKHVHEECPNKDKEANFSPNCPKCITFDMPNNPYFKRCPTCGK